MDVVRYLVEEAKVQDPNKANNDGETPLYLAMLHDHTEISLLLIGKSKDLHFKDPDGDTILHNAARKGQLAICQAIVDKVENVDPKDEEGRCRN